MSSESERMRLQQFLARCGVDSRRKCEAIITAGRVTVNGQVADVLGVTVDPQADVVAVDGARVQLPDSTHVIMLNKPCGFVTTMSDPQGRPTVATLVPADRFAGLFPVGRLDRDTSGLLLFATDGDLGNGLLHPRRHVEKRYFALVEGVMSARAIRRLEEGVMLDDGMTLPARVQVLEGDELAYALKRLEAPTCFDDAGQLCLAPPAKRHAKDRKRRSECTCVAICIHEGRKRQVRRMMREVGNPVVALHRDDFGPLNLGSVPRGAWRELTTDEIAALRRACLGDTIQ